MDGIKIEEVAKRTGLTKRAIRYYEDFGLITPPERTQGGIRLYSEANIEKINKILLAKEVLGFSLTELQQHIAFHDFLEQQRSKDKTLEDREARREKLYFMKEGIQKEQQLLDTKIERMNQFKEELNALEKRVLDALEQLEE